MKYNSPTLINKFSNNLFDYNFIRLHTKHLFLQCAISSALSIYYDLYCILIVSCFKKIEKKNSRVYRILLMTIRLETGKSLSKQSKFKKMLIECPWNPIIYCIFQFYLSFLNATTSNARLMEIVSSYATLPFSSHSTLFRLS